MLSAFDHDTTTKRGLNINCRKQEIRNWARRHHDNKTKRDTSETQWLKKLSLSMGTTCKQQFKEAWL